MGRPDVAGERRLRLANSSPDVKALFNSPAYIYDFEEQEDVQTNYVPGHPLDYWTPLPPIVCYCVVQILANLHVQITGIWDTSTHETSRRCVEARIRFTFGSKTQGTDFQTTFLTESCTIIGLDDVSVPYCRVNFSSSAARISYDINGRHWRKLKSKFSNRPVFP